ncbi:hypothetical protein ACPCYV_47700 [Streptomyces mordarskii]
MSEVYRFIAAEKAVHPVALLCRVLGVVRSSFYAWLEAEEARQARTRADGSRNHRNPVPLEKSSLQVSWVWSGRWDHVLRDRVLAV